MTDEKAQEICKLINENPIAIYEEQMGRKEWAEALARLPERMHGGIVRWVVLGIKPGSFLTAVVNNNMFEAMSNADDENRARITEYINFFYNYSPASCWGTEAVNSWKGSYYE